MQIDPLFAGLEWSLALVHHQRLTWSEGMCVHISARKGTQHQESGTTHNPVCARCRILFRYSAIFFSTQAVHGFQPLSSIHTDFAFVISSSAPQANLSFPLLEKRGIINQGLPGPLHLPVGCWSLRQSVLFNTDDSSALLKSSASF